VKSPLDLSEEEWNNVLKTNLTGAWLVSKYVCIRMRDAERGGSIINISSISGIDRGQKPGSVAYASSKAGLNALTKVTSFIRLAILNNCLEQKWLLVWAGFLGVGVISRRF
jgi:NAD(P)-dependent dehydrogenase (short-subunit alcohol dehydrogenase family)